MASSRLLHLAFLPSPAATATATASMARPFQRGIHAVAANASSPESQRLLQFNLESIIRVVGGEMIVEDMRFTRDGFDYWRNAAIPSNLIVKELASTWADVGSSSGTPSMSLKVYVEQTAGKRMEDFLQKVVADVEQRFSKEGLNLLKGRRLDMQLTDKEEVISQEWNLDSTLCIQSAGRHESTVHENLGAKMESNTQIADEQEILEKEGKPEAEEGFTIGREDSCSVAVGQKTMLEEKIEARYSLEEKEGAKAKSSKQIPNDQGIMATTVGLAACGQHQGLEAQIEEAKVLHAKEKGIKREDSQLAAVEQKAVEKGKKLEDTQRIESKGGAEFQNAKAREQNYGVVKDLYHQQTDNIVKKTRRMGKKIVHIYYYDKSSSRRVSL
ncbi:hypothetical protein GOP47_0026395 [Adiantum capillus-veneris]|nr:hypothetical protein GOP47_0026395 [Adiantum capillus-veneris]